MKKFLIAAQEYARNRGDDYYWFCEVYGNYRSYMNIDESAWYTLSYLYGNDVANNVKQSSSPSFI